LIYFFDEKAFDIFIPLTSSLNITHQNKAATYILFYTSIVNEIIAHKSQS